MLVLPGQVRSFGGGRVRRVDRWVDPWHPWSRRRSATGRSALPSPDRPRRRSIGHLLDHGRGRHDGPGPVGERGSGSAAGRNAVTMLRSRTASHLTHSAVPSARTQIRTGRWRSPPEAEGGSTRPTTTSPTNPNRSRTLASSERERRHLERLAETTLDQPDLQDNLHRLARPMPSTMAPRRRCCTTTEAAGRRPMADEATTDGEPPRPRGPARCWTLQNLEGADRT